MELITILLILLIVFIVVFYALQYVITQALDSHGGDNEEHKEKQCKHHCSGADCSCEFPCGPDCKCKREDVFGF